MNVPVLLGLLALAGCCTAITCYECKDKVECENDENEWRYKICDESPQANRTALCYAVWREENNLRKAGCHHFYREGCVGPGEVPELIVEADDDICFCGTNLCNAAAGCGTAIVLFFLSAVSSLLSPQ